MSDVKIYPAREINNFSVSVYSNKPEMHAYEHPDMVSVKVSDLFPGMPEAIYSHSGDDLKPTADSTREALKNIDMSRIKPGDSVNIMTCEHGFLMCPTLRWSKPSRKKSRDAPVLTISVPRSLCTVLPVRATRSLTSTN